MDEILKIELTKFESRPVTDEERYKVAEYLVDDFNEGLNTIKNYGEVLPFINPNVVVKDTTMVACLEDLKKSSLFIAYDLPNGETYIILMSLYVDSNGGWDNSLDKFVIRTNGIINMLSDDDDDILY